MSSILALSRPVDDPDGLADLIERIARDADRGAFARLFGWYAPRVKAVLLKLGAPAPRADDLTVEVMAAVWRQAARFDRAAMSPDTWIFRITRNLNLGAFRGRAA